MEADGPALVFNFESDTMSESRSSDLTYESLVEVTRRMEEIQLPSSPEVYVTTTDVYQKLRDELESENPQTPGDPISCHLGVPIEHFPTFKEAGRRLFELRSFGVQVGFISPNKES